MPTETEVLKSFPLLYKGKRMLVIDNRARYIDDDYDVIVWDRMLGCEVGFCGVEPDGSFSGWVGYGPHELDISGATAKELAASTRSVVNWTLKN
jgi:hypothetical protein